MTGKMKVALGGGAALAGGSAGGVTYREYSGPINFFISDPENKQNAHEVIEIIKGLEAGEMKTLNFPDKCIIWIQKMDTEGQTESNRDLTPEWKEKILSSLTDLSGFFKKSNLRSFLRKCGEGGAMKHIQLRWNSNKTGWRIDKGGDLFE